MKSYLLKTSIFLYWITYGIYCCQATTLIDDLGMREMDSLALVSIYHATNGTDWFDNSGWLTDSLENWRGITLSEDGCQVIAINLADNNLDGDLPVEISQLTQLTHLYLDNNDITSLPSTISNLSTLQELNIATNRLASIPIEIGQLSALTKLNIERNGLTELPPELGQLTNLQDFRCSSNKITEFPIELGQLNKLQQLYIGNNNLSNLPIEFGQLSNLQKLYADNNDLQTLPTEFGQLSNLVRLNLAKNSLPQLPTVVCKLRQLKELNISDNLLIALPDSISNLSQLQILIASDNQFTTLAESIGSLKQLQRLNIYNNQLNIIPPSLKSLSSLQYLDLSYNNISILPPFIGQLNSLQYLTIRYNSLYSIPIEISQLPNLLELDLSGNQLSGHIPPEIGQLSNLTFLNLEYNQLTGIIPPEIGQLTGLKNLFLAHNQLEGNLPTSIGNFTNIECIYVNDNNLSGTVPIELLVVNQTFGIQNNHFTFDGLEDIAPNIPSHIAATYAPQQLIVLNRTGNTLHVTSGGTPINNLYAWYKDGVLIHTGDQLIVTEAGTYHCEVINSIVTNSEDAGQHLILMSESITIEENSLTQLFIDVNLDTICTYHPVEFAIQDANTTTVYKWYINNTPTHEGAHYEVSFPDYTPHYTLQVIATQADLTILDTASMLLTVYATPKAHFSHQIINFQTLSFANYSTPHNESVTYHWDFGDGQTSTQKHPTHQYQAPGNYEICLTVTNHCGATMECQTIDLEQKQEKHKKENVFSEQ